MPDVHTLWFLSWYHYEHSMSKFRLSLTLILDTWPLFLSLSYPVYSHTPTYFRSCRFIFYILFPSLPSLTESGLSLPLPDLAGLLPLGFLHVNPTGTFWRDPLKANQTITHACWKLFSGFLLPLRAL